MADHLKEGKCEQCLAFYRQTEKELKTMRLLAAWRKAGTTEYYGGRNHDCPVERFGAPIGSQLKNVENAKNAANLSIFSIKTKLPKLRTWVRFPWPAP